MQPSGVPGVWGQVKSVWKKHQPKQPKQLKPSSRLGVKGTFKSPLSWAAMDTNPVSMVTLWGVHGEAWPMWTQSRNAGLICRGHSPQQSASGGGGTWSPRGEPELGTRTDSRAPCGPEENRGRQGCSSELYGLVQGSPLP